MEPFFVGTFDLTIDPKNRISIPSAVRVEFEELRAAFATQRAAAPSEEGKSSDAVDSTLFLLPGDRREILAIYDAGYFKSSRLGLPPTQQLSRHVRDWSRFEAGLTAKVEPDNQGRVLIPDRLMKISKLTRDVALVGAVDHYEIWSRADYQTFLESKLANYEEGFERTVEELAPYRKSSVSQN
jgi:MraZ protein